MRAQVTTSFFPKLHPKARVVLVDGYGIRVFVRHGRLRIEDGLGRQRREAEFTRATVPFKRLVILGHEGFITLEAIRWLSGVGAALVQIDRNGKLLATSAMPGRDDPRLRRAQAQAPISPVGVEVARELLRHKLTGQLDVATAMLNASPDVRQRIHAWLVAVEDAEDLQALLHAEAQAALWYWGAWERLEVGFGTRDASLVPDHWRTFGQRRSLHGHGPRGATNSANAILNFLYSLLEAECRLACQAVGLDPGLGIFHTDQQSRDSMALDLMEAIRPSADAYLIKLLASRKIRRRDFTETPDGTVRILAPLTHQLALALPLLRKKAAPVVENTARTLTQASGRKGRLPTPLTRDNNSAAQSNHRVGARHDEQLAPSPPACRECGLVLDDRGRMYCDECLSALRLGNSENIRKAHGRLRELRAQGTEPMAAPEVRKKIGRNNRVRQRAILEWEAVHGRDWDSTVFRQEVLPGLQNLTVTRMATQSGLSIQYCSQIRSGKKVPHPMHWEALARLAGTPLRPSGS
jgi:CRISPR-associated endonuclease Cas1